MISLITGQPGNGKSLFALWFIKTKADQENRPVFYHGISNLAVPGILPWTEFKAEEWPDLPDGSIVLIDEAQFVFPRKPNGAVLPAHYEKLAVHRHKGLDIFVITQHPSLIDNFVRKLVGQHFHSKRKFGLERATIYEWSETQPAPENAASHKSAITLAWPFKKEVYTWYKSAEVHTVKKKIPAKLFLVGVFVLCVIAALVMFVKNYGGGVKNEVSPVLTTSTPGVPGAVPGAHASPGKAPFDALADAREYVAMNTPRVAGLPQTAPKYDPLTKPDRVPVPAACIQVGRAESGKVDCKCFTQQGTAMGVEFNMCVEFARNGYFQEFDADKDRKQEHRTAAGVAVLANRPDQPLRDAGAISLAFADAPVSKMEGARPPPNLNDGPPPERASRTVIAE